MLVVCSLRKSKAHIFWLVESMEEGCGIPDITLIPSEVPWGYPLCEQKGTCSHIPSHAYFAGFNGIKAYCFSAVQVKKGILGVSQKRKKDYGSVVLVALVVGIKMNGMLPFADQ